MAGDPGVVDASRSATFEGTDTGPGRTAVSGTGAFTRKERWRG
jgi:hypothetical protein